ncbi:AAA family ATPase [Hydrogenophaga sp. BPS33]|uniref:AAA family ATPase n=1 Tax=Hydrogenophaga sp. BPS33 TaxID=2651974 RepID=UPI00131FF57A|nr:AAA family ATPase [Hydrogenophaga sp. BPS33]QHE85889.1 AAA family ATPase [Hydrogenophaga sp. BPS33]
MKREQALMQEVLMDAMDWPAETVERAPRLKPVSVADVFTHPSPPPAFLWHGLLPRSTVSLLSAHGGTGKSTLALMLGVAAATSRPLFDIAVEPGPAVFVSLEDGPGIVRHRLAHVCRCWGVNPALLDGRLHIVDGTEYPELFTAETRGPGETTATFSEMRDLVQSVGAGLVVVDNASDAFGGDEIQRRQVRAFMRSLVEIARDTNAAVLLLAHVDKSTSRARKGEGSEGYSGSTAWHNSARSRLFLSRAEDGSLTLEHQKSNLGKLQEPLSLHWPDGGLPELANQAGPSAFTTRMESRINDEKAAAVLRLLIEFESREQYASPATFARNNVHSLLKSEPAFLALKLRSDDTRRIVNQCQRAGWLEVLDYRSADRKERQRWMVTPTGHAFAGLSAPTAPTAPTQEDGAHGAGGAPTAPTCVGGMGVRAHTEDGAKCISEESTP